MKQMLGFCQGESVGTVDRVVFGKLLCQSGNCS